MPEDPRWRRDGRLPFQELQGQAVIVVPARREMHELDEAATFLWKALARDLGVKELAAALCEEFDVEPAEAEKDVREFVAELEAKGLVARA